MDLQSLVPSQGALLTDDDHGGAREDRRHGEHVSARAAASRILASVHVLQVRGHFQLITKSCQIALRQARNPNAGSKLWTQLGIPDADSLLVCQSVQVVLPTARAAGFTCLACLIATPPLPLLRPHTLQPWPATLQIAACKLAACYIAACSLTALQPATCNLAAAACGLSAGVGGIGRRPGNFRKEELRSGSKGQGERIDSTKQH